MSDIEGYTPQKGREILYTLTEIIQAIEEELPHFQAEAAPARDPVFIAKADAMRRERIEGKFPDASGVLGELERRSIRRATVYVNCVAFLEKSLAHFRATAETARELLKLEEALKKEP